MSRLHADIALLFAAAIWGLAFVFQKSAMSHVGPLTFLAARSTVAALALAPLAMREARRGEGTSGLGFLPIAIGGGVAFYIAGWLQQAGLVTSGGYGYRLNQSIALAYLRSDFAVPGRELQVVILGERRRAVVACEPLYDPDNLRLRA